MTETTIDTSAERATDTATEGTSTACDLEAFTPDERDEHLRLSATLKASIVETRDVPAGIALHLDGGRDALVLAARWAALESGCCPFWRFELTLEHGATTLLLTGPQGARELLTSMAAELAI
jgi:hypothetical protein